jgi:hypothetical protein
MELDRWLEAFEDFPLEAAETEIERLEDRLDELRTEEVDLVRRIQALKALFVGRSTFEGIKNGSMSVEVGRRAKGFPASGKAIRVGPQRGETSKAVVSVMETDPTRIWSVLDILALLERRDQLPRSGDPRRALDATLHRLATKTKDIERVGRGLYMLPAGHPARQTSLQDEGG